MQLMVAYGVLHGAALSQHDNGQGDCRNALHEGPSEHIDGVHGAEPPRIGGDQPVKCPDGQRESKHRNKHHAVTSEFAMKGQSKFGVTVLLQ